MRKGRPPNWQAIAPPMTGEREGGRGKKLLPGFPEREGCGSYVEKGALAVAGGRGNKWQLLSKG